MINSLLRGTPDPPTALASSPAPKPTDVAVLEAELLSLFDRSQLFTPQDFRGAAASNRERVEKLGGWMVVGIGWLVG